MLKKILFLVLVGFSIASAHAAGVRVNAEKGDKVMVSVNDYQAVKETINLAQEW